MCKYTKENNSNYDNHNICGGNMWLLKQSTLDMQSTWDRVNNLP